MHHTLIAGTLLHCASTPLKTRTHTLSHTPLQMPTRLTHLSPHKHTTNEIFHALRVNLLIGDFLLENIVKTKHLTVNFPRQVNTNLGLMNDTVTRTRLLYYIYLVLVDFAAGENERERRGLKKARREWNMH